MTTCTAFRIPLLLCWLFNVTTAFVEPNTLLLSRPKNIHPNSLSLATSVPSTLGDDFDSLDVVLFGVGDLRTDDHEGLKRSLENAKGNNNSRVLPLVLLDQESLANIPGIVAHTVDTASMLVEALTDLKENLSRQTNLSMHVAMGGPTMSKQLSQVLEPFLATTSKIRVHVCDLGDADNNMGYAPIANLKDNLPSGVEVHSWSCHMWDEPWAMVESLPEAYPDFAKKYTKGEPTRPTSAKKVADADVGVEMKHLMQLPTSKELCQLLQETLSLETEQCLAETNSGMFGTHWGGLDLSTIRESKVLETLKVYVEDCGEDDEAFAKLPLECTRNSRSLEHATMAWTMRGDGSKETPEPNNLIAGERLTRYLLAPLFFGTLSPRRLWHSVKSASPFFASPFRTLVETREWHNLLAARNIRTSPEYQSASAVNYKYWRWHGFLCRYAEADVTSNEAADKEGLLLVHGFGASGSQWIRSIHALSDTLDIDTNVQCLAPDLIGFGQSEKPPITYTGYCWEAYTGDFIKEVATAKCKWNSFVIGGNSIGGFVSICAAANDATVDSQALSGSGAPGTGKCTGAVLMNPAGVIQTQAFVADIEEQVDDKTLLKSVAQVTAMDALAPCKPFPRPMARVFGTGLLTYLRPRIDSICKGIYPINPDGADAAFCKEILRDSLDPGAINVMISGSKLPTSRTYNEVVAADFGQSYDSSSLPESTFTGPILMAQGILDPLNDAKGRAEQLGTLRSGITISQLQGGHCPHHEIPQAVASSISEWMEETRAERMSMVRSNNKESVEATTN